MAQLIGILGKIRKVCVAVIGDYLCDTYTIGKVERISPEAPVSVLHVEREERRPGGAGNVLLNLISLGAQTIAIGRVGADSAGRGIIAALAEEGADVRGMVIEEGVPTPVKNRFIAGSQQLLRADFEKIIPLSPSCEQQIIEKLPQLLEKAEAIAISDYGKGFLSPSLLAEIISFGKQKKIPTIVDPKGDSFAKYQGATILKPNLQEAYMATLLPRATSLERVADKIFRETAVEFLMITRSEEGISLFSPSGERWNFPTQAREVKDVTGAGDTVLAMLSIAAANGLDTQDGIQLANIAAGVAVERSTCAQVQLSDLIGHLLASDIRNKIFSSEQLFSLQLLLSKESCSLLEISGIEEMGEKLFRTIRKIATDHPKNKLLVSLRDEELNEELLLLLASLSEVHFIVRVGDGGGSLSEFLNIEKLFRISGEEA